MSADFVTVLDLGSNNARCLAARTDTEGVELIAASIVPSDGVRRGLIEKPSLAAAAIDEALRKVERGVGVKIERLVVAIDGAKVEGTKSQGLHQIFPPGRGVSRSDLLRVIEHSRTVPVPEGAQQVQVLPRAFAVDGKDAGPLPEGMQGRQLTVSTFIVTAPTFQIEAVENALHAARCDLQLLVLGPLASGLGVLLDEDLRKGAAVIDFGGGTTSIGIFSRGTIAYSHCLPVGCNAVTSDLSKLLEISPSDAEAIKLEYATCLSHSVDEDELITTRRLGYTTPRQVKCKYISEITEARVREIATLCQSAIQSSGAWAEVNKIVLTGGGSRLHGARSCFESVFGTVPVRTAAPTYPGSLRSEVNAPEMSRAFGLAKFVLAMSEEELSPASHGTGFAARVKNLWANFSGR